ncbi:MAG: hypothetical protein WC943_09360 [Elusimicrobiota bacterium]
METDLSREELLRHVRDLNAELLSLREKLRLAKDQNDWMEEAIRKRTRVLNERVKELDAVCQAVQIVRNPDLRSAQRVGRIVDLLPKALQHPDKAAARAKLWGREFRSARFRETPWVLSEPVMVKGFPEGSVEMCCLEDLPQADEGPFLREERVLLKTLAECLGAVLDAGGPDS